MLNFPGNLNERGFLKQHWQKSPLLLPAATANQTSSFTRNDLAWMSMQEDVESRLVFVDRQSQHTRYRVETGPFDERTLQDLPKRDWTLLVHDVEKHLPAMRHWFDCIPFIPDWRIDDLMVSFAAPGGGVGPHQDNYDVFLCQGIGVRNWRYSVDTIPTDALASDDLQLLEEFAVGENRDCRAGDVLYLPPGVAHWGVAKRACMTYSIGMRAPDLSDLAQIIGVSAAKQQGLYTDSDLSRSEARPGYISPHVSRRVCEQLNLPHQDAAAVAIGQIATQCKAWLTPDKPDARSIEKTMMSQRPLRLHGWTRIAYDEQHCFVNGHCFQWPGPLANILATLCTKRRLSSENVGQLLKNSGGRAVLHELLANGAFD